MVKVLFVCLGNICRSPLAEAIFRDKVSKKGLKEHFEAESCGTSNYNLGDPADPRTIKNAANNGIHLNHRARQLGYFDLDAFDHMDESNLNQTLALASTHHRFKIKLMRSFDPVEQGDVPDPYHGQDSDFQEVFEILDRSIDHFISSLKQGQ